MALQDIIEEYSCTLDLERYAEALSVSDPHLSSLRDGSAELAFDQALGALADNLTELNNAIADLSNAANAVHSGTSTIVDRLDTVGNSTMYAILRLVDGMKAVARSTAS